MAQLGKVEKGLALVVELYRSSADFLVRPYRRITIKEIKIRQIRQTSIEKPLKKHRK